VLSAWDVKQLLLLLVIQEIIFAKRLPGLARPEERTGGLFLKDEIGIIVDLDEDDTVLTKREVHSEEFEKGKGSLDERAEFHDFVPAGQNETFEFKPGHRVMSEPIPPLIERGGHEASPFVVHSNSNSSRAPIVDNSLADAEPHTSSDYDHLA